MNTRTSGWKFAEEQAVFIFQNVSLHKIWINFKGPDNIFIMEKSGRRHCDQ